MRTPPFVYWVCLWVASSAAAIVAMARDPFLDDRSVIVGRDFSNMWTAGRLTLDGLEHRAFDIDSFRIELLDHLGILSLQNFSYPPHALFIDAPFALLPYFAALALWMAVSMAFFVWTARPYLPAGFPKLLAALTPAATLSIWDGQYGLVLGGLWLIVYASADMRPGRAGFAAGLMTFKPHLGILVAALLLGRRRAFLSAAATTLALVLISGLLFGWASWLDFLFATTREQTEILNRRDGHFYFAMMPAAYPAFGQGWIGGIIHAGFALAAAALLVPLRGRPAKELAFPSATATFLILPYAFNYDMTVVSLGFAILIFTNFDRLSVRDRTIATAAFAAPQVTFFFTPLVPILLLAGLALQCRLLKDEASLDHASGGWTRHADHAEALRTAV